MELHQRIENVTTLAGQTVTVSFYAKADASRALTLTVLQYFGSGGSAIVTPVSAVSLGNATTSFQRFTYTFSMPQTTGKTIATGNFVDISINMPASAFTIDFWGLQVEASNTATSFNTATGTIQGELAACQRYYYRTGGEAAYQYLATVAADASTNVVLGSIFLPVKMRTAPTLASAGSWMVYAGSTIKTTADQIGTDVASSTIYGINLTGLTGMVSGQAGNIRANNSLAAYVALSAEL
jgi:hypothetical protein